MAGGMILLAVADSGFAYMTQLGDYATGGVLDTAWVAGFLLIGLGAAQSMRTPSVSIQGLRPWVALPYIPVSIALVTMVVILLKDQDDVFAVIVSAAVVALVMARQVLTLQDNVRLAKRLEHLAFHDSLTGLANRTLFLERAERALVRQAHDNSQLALLYIDLDGFKEVNDTLGHPAGDALLDAVGRRLRSCVRATDTVARLGGDEFAVLVEHLDSAGDADALAAWIVTAIADPFLISASPDEKDPPADRSVTIGASVGIAVTTHGGEQAGELLRRADVAMYTAKLRGKSQHVRLPTAAGGFPTQARAEPKPA
jgi:diguanylate cyclase (GGDEF)-like protein